MSADLSITITGVDRLVAKFGRVQAINYLRPPMQRSLDRLRYQMVSAYDTPRKGSKYRRTVTYGRKWETKMETGHDGLTGKVGISLYYAPRVGSAKFQAKIHRGIWTTDRQAVQRERSAIVRDFNITIAGALR